MIPSSRPQASPATVRAALQAAWSAQKPGQPFPDFCVGMVRGYYLRSMGDPAKNDRGIYDDAAFVLAWDAMQAFNANSDPSPVYRPGIATLLPGIYPYRPGNHGISRPGGGYPAFRPATPGEALPVRRDGEARVPSARPGVAINIHRGSRGSTSSEGCQTIHPTQWGAFHAAVHAGLTASGQKTFFLILIEGPL
jgi:hypothetical protein